MTLSSRHPSGLLPAALVMVSCATHTRFVTTPVPDLVNRPITQVTVVGVVGFRGLPIGAGTEAECALLLAESLRTRNAVLTVPHPADDRALLEQAGLGFAWAALADTWLETGIADAVLNCACDKAQIRERDRAREREQTREKAQQSNPSGQSQGQNQNKGKQ